MRERHIPDVMNSALMTLLPKTSEGLSNLLKTRPIALMEILTKVYERIIMGRIVVILEEHDMLNKAQYGGLAKMGTAAPLRVMTNVLENARDTGHELHLFVADLSKAFDSMEYWTQGLSWRALGMQSTNIGNC